MILKEAPPACPYCDKPAKFVLGDVIYPHRPDLAHKQFYHCAPCGAYVGCHDGTTKPLGRLANAELRKAKMDAHAAFDPHWQGRKMARVHAYRLLANKLGIRADDCHIGMFDVETCKRVVDICKHGLK